MLMMLLQAGPIFGQVRQQQPQGPDPGTMAGIFICYGVVIVVSIIINILFLLNISKCLAQCSPRNRTMEPGQVWLNFIPFFGVVWIFITFIRVSESLQNEYRERRMRSDDPDFGKMTGILYMVLSIVCGPIGLIFFIMYWMKISKYKNELISNKRRGGSSAYGDDEEDRPRRGGRRRDVEDDDDEDDRPRRRRDED